MLKRLATSALAVVILPTSVFAQHGAAPARAALAPAAEARQFDFLIGQWELAVTPKVSGLAARIHGVPKLVGTWKAWRAFDGFGITDDVRIVDASGNPAALTSAIRVYDANARHWVISNVDVYRARASEGTAAWTNGEMVSSGQGVDADGKPTLTRTRFYGISPRGFTYQQDRSSDGGKTWDEAVLKIVATRVSAEAPR